MFLLRHTKFPWEKCGNNCFVWLGFCEPEVTVSRVWAMPERDKKTFYVALGLGILRITHTRGLWGRRVIFTIDNVLNV